VAAKLDDCRLELPSGTRCNEKGDKKTLCAARCSVDAMCSDILSDAKDTAYVRCGGLLGGSAPDDFICASGSAFLPRTGVCDGTPGAPPGAPADRTKWAPGRAALNDARMTPVR
jgi:hypothetical protein